MTVAGHAAPAPEDASRTERRKAKLRARVLEAAAELFERDGIEATSVEALCARADVARRTFFNHFPSKQELVRELAGYAVEQLLGEIRDARSRGRDTGDRLRRFFTAVAERTAAGGPTHREFVVELVHAVHASPEKSGHARALHHAFEEIVREGLAAGEVTRRHDPETLTEMILGAYYVLMFSFANLEDFPIRKQADATARFLTDALAPAPEE